MSGAHGYAQTVEQRAYVEMMDVSNVERYDGIRRRPMSVDRDALYLAEPLQAVFG